MKDLFEKPAAVVEAAETKKGWNWAVELLVFVVVFIVCTIGQILFMMPTELMMLYRDQAYQAALGAADADAIMEASMQLASSDAYMIVSLFSDAMMILLVCLFCKLIQKRKMSTLGFRKKNMVREYLTGMLAGFVVFSAAVLLGVLSGGLKINGISPEFSIGFFLMYLLGYMVQGMGEEVLCRGYLLVSIGRRYPMYLAILLNSVFFAALHLFNGGITVLAFINLSLFGIFASVYFIRRGNIWGIGAFHSIWNLVQGNFYGIRVSGMSVSNSFLESVPVEGKDLLNGGAFGMEGSIFATLVLVAGIVILYFRKGKEDEMIEAQ